MSSLGRDDVVTSFMAVTGADAASAQQFLEVTNWNLNEAVTLFMESGGHTASPPRASSQASTAYGATPSFEDDAVRAPDQTTREQLVGGFSTTSGRGGGSRRRNQEFQDFAADSIAAINALTNNSIGWGGMDVRDANGNPSTSVFAAGFGNDGDSNVHMTESESAIMTNRQRDLRSLFQPPVGLMFHGTYSDARQRAADENKWLLVNVQDETVFASHMLNRDTWSDDIVQNIVASGFVFWQTYLASDHGKRFLTLYQLDSELLPLILILNPRTGEKVMEWTGFLGSQELAEKLSDFCCSNTLEESETQRATGNDAPSGLSKSAYPATTAFAPKQPPPAPSNAGQRSSSMVDMSEEDQLAAAIAASLEERGDQDETAEKEPERKQNPKQAAAKADSESEKQQQHEQPLPTLNPEPAPGAANTTRVQIRFPDGTRVVRRFLKDDAVSNLWAFVQHHCLEARSRAFELRTSFPPLVLDFNDHESIADRRLENAMLLVQWKA